MDRNSIIGIVVIAGLLILWTTLNKPSKEEIEAAKYKRDSLELVQQQQMIQQEKSQTDVVQKDQDEVAIEETKDLSQYQSQYGGFAEAASGKQEFTTLENEHLRIKISNKGGKIYSVELKDYKTYSQKPLLLFDGDSTVFGLQFNTADLRGIETNNLYFIPSEKSSNSVKMRLYSGENRYLVYVYTLSKNDYLVDFDINFVGFNEILANNITVLDLKWSMYVPQLEKGAKNENMYTTIGYKYYQDEVNTLRSRGKDDNREELLTKLKW
ncbi:MAG: hypothetical protein C0597_05840, partial [Marinilabiliales bacterium]